MKAMNNPAWNGQIGIGSWLNERGGETRIIIAGNTASGDPWWQDDFGNYYDDKGNGHTYAPGIIGPWSEPAANAMPVKILRDEFAMAALTGMIAGGQGLQISTEQFAAQSYKLADAMLAARETRGKTTSTELRPCPFCGSAAELVGDDAPENWVRCGNAERCSPSGRDKNRLRAAWNTRTDDTEITEDMKLAGARSIGTSMRWPNHAERAAACFAAMMAVRVNGTFPPVPKS